MGYIEELRQIVGPRPLILVGAATLIVNEQGELLMHHRVESGCWSIPGGFMEMGESSEENARREVREALGLELGALTLFDIFSGADAYCEYVNGDQVHNVTVVFITNQYSGPLRLNPTQGHQAQFFARGAMPTNLSPPIRPVINRFVEGAVTLCSP